MAKFVHEVFPGADGEVLGTVTPDYMAAPELDRVVPRMAETSPDARLIAILRDPLERAISDFRQELRRGLVLSDDFGEHIGSDDKVLRTSEYGATLTRYLEYFKRDQLLVVFTSDFEESPQSVYDDIFRFLGVKSFTPPTDVRLNVGGPARVRPEALDEIAEEAMRLFATSSEQERAFRWWLRHCWNTEPQENPVDLSPKLRRRLEWRFREDGELLRALGVEPPWLQPSEDDVVVPFTRFERMAERASEALRPAAAE